MIHDIYALPLKYNDTLLDTKYYSHSTTSETPVVNTRLNTAYY